MIKVFNILVAGSLMASAAFAQTPREDIDASVKEEDQAKIAMMKKDYETAYSHLQKAIALDPTNSRFLNSAAYLAMEAEDFDQALAYLNEALRLDTAQFGEKHGNVASVLNNIANVYAKMGDTENAISHRQRAYDLFVETYGDKHPQAEFIKNILDDEKAK